MPFCHITLRLHIKTADFPIPFNSLYSHIEKHTAIAHFNAMQYTLQNIYYFPIVFKHIKPLEKTLYALIFKAVLGSPICQESGNPVLPLCIIGTCV